MRRLRVKPISIQAHPKLYEKMEEIRKQFMKKENISLSQMELTNIIATRVKIPQVNLLKKKNGNNKK